MTAAAASGGRTRPYVVVHVAVSLEGATTGFQPDLSRFYELAAGWREDVTLVGSDTVLAQADALAAAPRPGPTADGPLLVVVDGRGRVRQWDALREVGHWREVLALSAAATPPRPPSPPVQELVVGAERVDLAAALTLLGRDHGAEVVRVDSGGALNAALLAAGLVDELSLLVHPCIVGERADHRWHGQAPAPARGLTLIAGESFDPGLVWLRYRLDR